MPLISHLRPTRVGLLLAASLASAVAEAQDARFRNLPHRCYQLRLGEWSHAFSSGWPEVHIPPEVIRFDTAEVTFPRSIPDGFYKLRPNVAAISATRRPWDPSWTRSASDSLRLLWTTGFSGVMLDLEMRDDSLFGMATARYDVVGPPLPRARVTGWRVSCPPNLEP